MYAAESDVGRGDGTEEEEETKVRVPSTIRPRGKAWLEPDGTRMWVPHGIVTREKAGDWLDCCRKEDSVWVGVDVVGSGQVGVAMP